MQVILESLIKKYGDRCLLEDLTFEFHSGKKSVLVGKNGSGKSTILSIIAGQLEPDAGRVVTTKGTIALMEQKLSGDLSRTIFQACGEIFADLVEQERQITEMHDRFEQLSDREQQQYATLVEAFEASGGYDWQRRIENVLLGVGFLKEQFEKKLSQLSGGQQRRYMMARILLQDADLLLLDEPTNHLDISSILWLENWIKSLKSTVIFISHDRSFLESVADEIVELDDRMLYRYPGNYEKFREMREEKRAQQAKSFQQQQKYIEKNKEFIRRNISGQKTKQAQARRKMLEKIERLEPPSKESSYSFLFKKEGNEGQLVASAENLSKAFNNLPVLSDVTFSLYRGEKIGVLGMNGCGKSTLLRLLVAEESPDSGSVAINQMAKVGYFPQDGGMLDPEKSLIDTLWSIDASLEIEQVRNMLGAFLFSGEEAEKKVALLSGGEKSRLLFACLMVSKPNFLILDEPTNHLDLQSRILLENVISQYDGSVLVVSHDRRFLDETVDAIFCIRDGALSRYTGNVSDNAARIFVEDDSRNTQQSKKQRTADTKNPSKVKKRDNERQVARGANKYKVQKIEAVIHSIEEQLRQYETDMISEEAVRDKRVYEEIAVQYANLKNELERRYLEWEEICG